MCIRDRLIIAYLLVPLFSKMNLVSIYDYVDNRFGISPYRTGAWFFFISKMLGAAVRLFLVCLTLQLLVLDVYKRQGLESDEGLCRVSGVYRHPRLP